MKADITEHLIQSREAKRLAEYHDGSVAFNDLRGEDSTAKDNHKRQQKKQARKAAFHLTKAADLMGTRGLGNVADPRWLVNGTFYQDGLVTYYQRALFRHFGAIQEASLALKDLDVFREKNSLGTLSKLACDSTCRAETSSWSVLRRRVSLQLTKALNSVNQTVRNGVTYG